jgi:hypothetical protein
LMLGLLTIILCYTLDSWPWLMLGLLQPFSVIHLIASYQVYNREWLSANPTSIRISYQLYNREWLSENPMMLGLVQLFSVIHLILTLIDVGFAAIILCYTLDSWPWLMLGLLTTILCYTLDSWPWLMLGLLITNLCCTGSAINCITENGCQKTQHQSGSAIKCTTEIGCQQMTLIDVGFADNQSLLYTW